tara:strand:+ start:954 stop:1118 length:165 start_codon:yes stop_codon:yes gene_type:complete
MREGASQVEVECKVCASNDLEMEHMFLVSGQVGGPEKEIEVAVCRDCGHRMAIP